MLGLKHKGKEICVDEEWTEFRCSVTSQLAREIKGCLLKQERAKGKQWKALWSVIRVAVEAFKSLNEVWCNFISVPGQKGQQVGCTESLSGDEGQCHLQPNKQLDAPSQTPASVMDEGRCLNVTAVIFCVVALLRFSLSLCAFQVDFQTCVCKHTTQGERG